MDMAHFFDATAAGIVCGGTLLATALRCGAADCRVTLAALGQLWRPRFDPDPVRAALAGQVSQIRQDGIVRARAKPLGDAEFDEATDAMIEARSLTALTGRHDTYRNARTALAHRAARTLAQGADLAPVFGLAGTLIGLTQMPAGGVGRGVFMGAISLSVLTTLYGLLLANIILAPLSRAIERRSQAEETARQAIVDWLVAQVTPACPPPHRAHDSHAHPREAA